jgi:hypothetical protein
MEKAKEQLLGHVDKLHHFLSEFFAGVGVVLFLFTIGILTFQCYFLFKHGIWLQIPTWIIPDFLGIDLSCTSSISWKGAEIAAAWALDQSLTVISWLVGLGCMAVFIIIER